MGDRVWGEYCTKFPVFRDRDGDIHKYRRAALKALAKAPPEANALIDVTLSVSTRNCARVEGKPVKLH
jgi:hypothetical protein